MAKSTKQRTVEDLLRDIARRESATGLLGVGGLPKGNGLLSATGGLMLKPDAVSDLPGNRPENFTDPNLKNGPGNMHKSGRPLSLLSPAGPEPQQPAATPPRRSPLAQAGNFLDDFLFGGAAGERAAERRQRETDLARAEAHRDAFAMSTRGGSFDPNAYLARMGELGHAPTMQDLIGVEGVADSQDVRGQRRRTERREVMGGAFAPLLGQPEDRITAAAPGVRSYLQDQGMAYKGPLNADAIASVVGGGMGANSFLDNQRGDRALGENIRSNQAAEQYREQDLGFRKTESAADRSLRERQFAADNEYRNSRAAAEDAYRAWEQQNSFTRSDIEGQVLRKAITSGASALTPEERAVYDRAVSITGGMGFGGMPGGLPPGVGGPAPNPTPAPAQVPVSPRPQGQPQTGNGSGPQSPARVVDEASFERLPVGAWFVNPADGQVMQKVR